MNHVHLRGQITGQPRRVELPAGTGVWRFDLEVVDDVLVSTTVPCIRYDEQFPWREFDQIDVVGKVRRRYYRVGGATQSRTEVQANTIVRIAP